MKEIESVKNIDENFVKLIDSDWGLVCAGKAENWNGMTASWGGVGELWNKDVVFIFIRPQRYTKKFIDEEDYFTLCFFDEKYKDALKICGTKSGRDFDKMKSVGFDVAGDGECVYPEQSKIVLKCRKIAVQEMDNSGFIDKSIEKNYNNDYHFIYVGEIEKVFAK